MKRVSDADIRLLRIFATVVECKGFTAAQAELNLSPSSISNYITGLEQRLGVRLCTRGRTGFGLTEKGAVIHREALRLFAAIDEFTTLAGAVRGRLTGTLNIGLVDCTVTDPNAPILGAIERFNQRDHDVQIALTIGAPASLQRGVLDGRLHLAIACFPTELSALPTEPLYDEINSLYCGADHRLFAQRKVTIEDVRASRVVARSYWRHADLSLLGVEREAATVEIMEAQAILILSGFYIGYLPEHYAERWVQEGRLRRLLPDALSYHSPFTLAVRRETAKLPVVRQFVEDLRASLKTPDPTRAPVPRTLDVAVAHGTATSGTGAAR